MSWRFVIGLSLGCSLASTAGFAQAKELCEPGWEFAGHGTCYLLGEPFIDEITAFLQIDGVLRVARAHHSIHIDAAIYKAGQLLCTTSESPSAEIVKGADVPFKLLCQLPPGRRVLPDKVTLRFKYRDD